MTLEARIANLSPAKRALLEQHLLAHKTDQHKEQVISRRAVTGSAPLSYAQQRLWFLAQLDPHSTAYNNTSAYKLRGNLNLPALQQSLNEIIRRHEVLRTTYTTVLDEPIQVINPAQPVALALTDLRHLAVNAWDDKIQQLVHAENRQPFDLSKDLMRRVHLLRFDEQTHVLLLTNHHIASDGWSTTIFWRELTALYGAFVQRQPSPLSELPLQYADYALWQRNTLQLDDANTHGATLVRYWQTQLAGAPALINLPIDFPRPVEQKALGKTWQISLPAALCNALKTLARQEEATLFMLLLAAFQLLLMRYTNQTDIVVGTSIANRQRPELEGLIGMFVNTLALRTDLAGNPPFRALLQRVRSVTLAAYQHRELPFEKLVEILQPERTLSHHPIVQVVLTLQNMPPAEFGLQDVEVTRLAISGETAKYDLAFSLREGADRLHGRLEYNSALFTPATIERLAGHYATLLAAIVTNPDCPIGQLPLLSHAEKQRLLVEWNQTQASYPKDQCLHHLFENQVTQTPEAVAVVCEGQSLTYHALNRRANQLAHTLQTRGVGPETLVALCIERSLDMLIGVLGILKAGGAYVPIDPAFPTARIELLLNDTHAKVLLTQFALLPCLPVTTIPILCLDTDDATLAQQTSDNGLATSTSSNLAYVLYTSGSTGRPKGVMVEHRQVVNYVYSMLATCVPPGSSCAMVQPLSVDSSLTMLFPPLLSGGTLHLIPAEQAVDAAALVHYFQQHTIDCLKIAPSHLAALQAEMSPGDLMPRRSLIIGGESSRWDWVQALQSLSPTCRVWNHYGPTETTVGVLIFPAFSADATTVWQNTPLGRPIANTAVYVLDQQQMPAPIGVVGELYIGGASVARGYLHQPAATQACFLEQQALPFVFAAEVSNPIAVTRDQSPYRLYRTGDLARYRADGTVEFLGRMDDQVKIRGFRIELGEIEQVILQHPPVRETVVLARADHTQAKRLVAYVVPKQAVPPAHQADWTTRLRDFLKATLPSQMLPAAIVVLDSWPRTSHGKIDRNALPAPALPADQVRRLIPARTPSEAAIATIWAQLLQVNSISMDDNFFELGGHSLLAIRVMVRVNQAFNSALPLRCFFEHPTVQALAKQIEQAQVVHRLRTIPDEGQEREEVIL